MSKTTATKRKRNVSKQVAAIAEKQVKSGPPKFLLKATDAVNAGALNAAIEILKEGIEDHPFTAYRGIGDVYLLQGKNKNAVEWLEKALELRPDSGALLGSLGRAIAGLGREDESAKMLSDAIKFHNNIKDIHALVESMHQMGKFDEAMEVMEEKANSDLSQIEVLFDLAMWYKDNKRFDKAEFWYKKILEKDEYLEAYHQLGIIYHRIGRISESVKYLKKVYEHLPNNGDICNNLARSVIESGDIEEGIKLLRKAVKLLPHASHIHSNLLFRLHYLPEIDMQMIFEEHKRWGQIHAPISMAKKDHNNSVEPNRKLRIGYISPDFRKHVVSNYFEPLLDDHDRQQFEVFGYGNVQRSDDVTKSIEKKFDRYRNIWGVNDGAIARVIEQDKIDILIDLAGHTGNNRLLVLARKPAPIQVTYLGSADTTGMEAVDYILTDNQITPPESQKFYTEELFPLTGGLLCYTPVEETPDVTAPPILENGFATFGAFITNRRFNPPLLKTWSEILKLTENSRLLLCFSGGDDMKVQENYLSQFKKHGVCRDRIEIRGWKAYYDYLRQYGEIDIALDTFPENGGTSTLNALWMGVPVISQTGQHQIGRYGLSFLSRIGLEFFAAKTSEEYVAKATALAGKPESLVELRKTMKERMLNSSLCDGKRFTRYVEMAYREMWHRWCKSQDVNALATD